jgi:phosphotransferase system HPr (HPr) family protein
LTERELEVRNRLGLHARAAAKLVHVASAFSARITVARNGDEVDAKSILGVLLLAAAQGARLRIRCDGPDEEPALAAVERLFAERFGEAE